jgi:hypothetical protein
MHLDKFCARTALCAFVGLIVLTGPVHAADDAALKAALAKIRAIAPQGAGQREAVAAARVAAASDTAQIPLLLAAMDGVNPLAENWLRGAVEAVASRTVAQGNKLPVAELEAFLAETGHSPRGRRLAYELVAGVDPSAERRLIPTLLDDPSLELRRDAVAQVLAAAAKTEPKDAARAAYQKAFHHARDLDQIKESAKQLKELGAAPDISRHMGFVPTWKIIGPFDNVGDRGWDTAYPPETKIDLTAELDGQKGKVRWIDHTTQDDYGAVDLAAALDKHKGAVAYAYTELIVGRGQPCDLRISSPNANKVWLNGELLTANHVYHANNPIDQYVGRGTLRPGKNSILVKACQNEQTEEWAQAWAFKLRVCDAVGTAILSADRTPEKNAAE